MPSTEQAPPPSPAALLAVLGSGIGGLILLAVPFVPFARVYGDWLVSDVRPRFDEPAGWVCVLAGVVAVLLPVLALALRNPAWLLGALVPGLAAIGLTLWFVTQRLPAYTRLNMSVDLRVGGMLCYAAGPLLIASTIPAFIVTRARLRAQDPT
ncbi:hypothetical protein Val02_58130 [Virgisporangium aliadipatigenens]|uniref:Uncharacterized protein n=1 Tax=Virgisporangium aliadipatigenens TaxID=741659 RepID=A0A8J4DU86_9ACTN|nr:hypothetical protein [Virgisporangium aliadipatigenens]GIJ48927.1 hypothetical protein Val02_58130 [Virgisporangium aliadipatigenens]